MNYFFLLFLSIFLFYPTHSAHADLAPPTIFTFKFHSKIDSPIEIISLEYHICSDLQCTEQGSQYFGECSGHVCETGAYPVPYYDYAQVIGTFEDGIKRSSDVFILPDGLYFGIQLTYTVFVYND
jgi:hypothetical protein